MGSPHHLEHAEAVESQQPLGEADTVVHRRGPSVVSALSSRDDGGIPAPRGGSSPTYRSLLQREEPGMWTPS